MEQSFGRTQTGFALTRVISRAGLVVWALGATPTVFDGKVFTQGATGIVNCLDARTGTSIWSHDTVAETGASLPEWEKAVRRSLLTTK